MDKNKYKLTNERRTKKNEEKWKKLESGGKYWAENQIDPIHFIVEYYISCLFKPLQIP